MVDEAPQTDTTLYDVLAQRPRDGVGHGETRITESPESMDEDTQLVAVIVDA